jgi:hypothetical protein
MPDLPDMPPHWGLENLIRNPGFDACGIHPGLSHAAPLALEEE